MKPELKIRNIVLVGAFNPLSFDRYFFVKNGIVTDEQINEKSLFLPQISQLITKSFQLNITPLQTVVNAIKVDRNENDIGKIASTVMKAARGQIITASGINFIWFLNLDAEEKIAEVSRKLCFDNNNPIQRSFFNTGDAHFGFYSSRDFGNCRMKLDVKPIKYRLDEKSDETSAIQFDFNFHRDYKEPDPELKEFGVTLKDYETFRKESENIISSIKL